MWWARGGVAAGAGVSIAANVAHSYIAPAGQDPETWDPPLAAVLGAACWPLALFLALEVLSSPLWRAGRWWWALRVTLVGPVAAVAAVVSYHHLSGLLASWHEDPFTVRFGPIAIDGLMGLCSALLFIARSGGGERAPSVLAERSTEPPERASERSSSDEPGSLASERKRLELVPSERLDEQPPSTPASDPASARSSDAEQAVERSIERPGRRSASARSSRSSALVDCSCGQPRCRGRVGVSTRSAHMRQVRSGAGG